LVLIALTLKAIFLNIFLGVLLGALALAKALAENTTVVSLTLDHNPLHNEGIFHLVDQVFPHNSFLRLLNLRDTEIGPPGAACIAAQLSHSHLYQLDLQDNNIGCAVSFLFCRTF
jgi:hypothetical protein